MTEKYQPAAQLIRYSRPDTLNKPRTIVRLGQTDTLLSLVQVLRQGGENNLHHHKYRDGFWFVLSGKARFYTTGDELIGEFGPGEGVIVPTGYPYWFESAGDEVLELLQVEAIASPPMHPDDLAGDRIDDAARTRDPASYAENIDGQVART